MVHDVFISYRRDGGEHFAARVNNALKSRGFSVFMDIEDLKSGKFDGALFRKIEQATDVIVILTPDCLNRCQNEDDWLRQEIRHAIQCSRNIVPVMDRVFHMPPAGDLPSDIAELVKYNGLTPTSDMFEQSIDRLSSNFLKSKGQDRFREDNGALSETKGDVERATASGQNALCPCGSGKIFGKCHGAEVSISPSPVSPMPTSLERRVLGDDAEIEQQLSLIEQTICYVIGVLPGKPIGPAKRARVKALSFDRSRCLTDVGASLLSDSQMGLRALTSLEISASQVTDAGLAALARPDTCLKALTTLTLSYTRVTDRGLTALASPDTGLKALTTLDLARTRITDVGLATLARPDTGLKALTTLILLGTPITDSGLMALAGSDTGLKALTTLHLGENALTEAGLAALARPDTGLKALTTLYLTSPDLTDDYLAALARPDTGLKALTTLKVLGKYVTTAGIELVRRRWPGITV